MKYTDSVTYIQQPLTCGEVVTLKSKFRLCIDPDHPSYSDANQVFNTERYKYPYLPLYLGQYHIPTDNINVNVLRLLIKRPDNNTIHIPTEVLPFKDFIVDQINYHQQYYSSNKDCFVYITIRTTEPNQCYYETAKEWHVDGFQGSRIKPHLIEQDIIWCNVNPTEFTLTPMFLENINVSKFNVLDYMNRSVEGQSYSGVENGVYVVTPYNIHRVTNQPFTKKRVFVRLTFSPVIIDDATNTPNPMLPQETSDREDIRNYFSSFNFNRDTELLNAGFKKL